MKHCLRPPLPLSNTTYPRSMCLASSKKTSCLSWLLLNTTQPNKGNELPLIRYPSTFSYSYSNFFLILKQNQELKAKRFTTSDIFTFSDSLLASHRVAWPRPPEIVEHDGILLVCCTE